MDFIELEDGVERTTGSSKLKAYTKDSNFSLLDALIRESTQNSIDAYDEKSNAGYIGIDVNYNDFSSVELSNLFPEIKDRIRTLYPDNSYKFLCLSDFNTVGLDGTTNSSPQPHEKRGNFNRLVFHTGRNEKHDDAGGAWGYGKAVYYKTGIGLVIFYSRVRLDNGTYENRLMVSITEDERKTNTKRLLPDDGNLGIAWYGVKKNSTTNSEFSALIDDLQISDILNIFGLRPYEGNTTGTKIIIPYVNEEELFSGFYKSSDEMTISTANDEEKAAMISVSYERWFCTRIDNRKFKNYLQVCVNGSRITNELLPRNRMIEIFNLYQTLYNYSQDPSYISDDYKDVKTITLKSKGYVKGDTLGVFSYIILKGADAKKLNDKCDQQNPYYLCGLESDDFEFNQKNQKPIIGFQRNLGMIADYVDSRSSPCGPWLKSTSENLKKDEYLIGLFVLSNNDLKDKYRLTNDKERKEPISLNQYIRNGEKSSHNVWSNSELYNLDRKAVENNNIFTELIQKRVATEIDNSLHTNKRKSQTGDSFKSLGMSLSRLLMPSPYSKSSTPNSKRNTKSNSTKKNTSIHCPKHTFTRNQSCLQLVFDDVSIGDDIKSLTFKFGLLYKEKEAGKSNSITCFDNKDLQYMKCPVIIKDVVITNKNTNEYLNYKFIKNCDTKNDSVEIGFEFDKPEECNSHVSMIVEYEVTNNEYSIGYDLEGIE